MIISSTGSIAGIPVSFTCSHCGRKLETRTIRFKGLERVVPCWGSCGCDESRLDGEVVQDGMRKYVLAGIPDRFLHADAETNGWERAVMSGRSLYIVGPYGSGKTYFACSLAKKLLDSGVSVRFENSKRLITEIQGTYSGSKTDVLERAYKCKALVLDDLGKEQPTEYSISMLYEVIDARYAAGRPVIVTTNFERDELLGRLARRDAATAEAIVSRLCDEVDVLRVDGADRRLG